LAGSPATAGEQAPIPRHVSPQESRRRARGDGARAVLGQQPDIALAERLAADGHGPVDVDLARAIDEERYAAGCPED